MTECERFIKEGSLSIDFFKEETICDFLVDRNRKKMWAVEIDLLKQIDRVCRKYRITYFLIHGSLLGAVRHHGFIPWDDDIDVAMPRPDYEEFLKHQDEFRSPYFLQTPYSDEGFYYAFSRLTNINTTALDYPFLFQGIKMGICIDIDPLDYVGSEDVHLLHSSISKLIEENSVAMRLTHPSLSERDKRRVVNYSGSNPIENYEMIQKIAKSSKSNEKAAMLVSNPYPIDRCTWDANDFAKIIECDFQGVKTFIPAGYDQILRKEYNDYMALPPHGMRVSVHANRYFAPDIPFPEAIKDWKTIYKDYHHNEKERVDFSGE